MEIQETKTCKKCMFFQERTGFCRLNPPEPVVIHKDGQEHITFVFKKIPMPNVDFCFKFKSI